MPNYRYVAAYARFYPDKHDADGQSLMAQAGMVVQWDAAPGAAEWIETDEPATWGGPAPEAPEPEPVQEPEPAQEAVSAPEPAPEPEPAPVPAPVPAAPEAAPEFAPPPVPPAPQPYIVRPAFGQPAPPSSN